MEKRNEWLTNGFSEFSDETHCRTAQTDFPSHAVLTWQRRARSAITSESHIEVVSNPGSDYQPCSDRSVPVGTGGG